MFYKYILFTFVFSVFAYSAPSTTTKTMTATNQLPGYIGLGLLSYETGTAATSATTGEKSFFGQTFYQLHISKIYSILNQKIEPLFQYGFIGQKSPDGQQKSNVSAIGTRLHFYPTISIPQFDLHSGFGLMAYRIQGKSGTVTLSNGSGTMDFGTSGETKNSTFIYLDLGANYKVDKNRFTIAFLLTKISDSDKKAVSTSLSYSREVF